MSSKSEKQRKLFALALSYKRGDTKKVSKKVKDIARSMTEEELEKFAQSNEDTDNEKVEESSHVKLYEEYNSDKENILKLTQEILDSYFRPYKYNIEYSSAKFGTEYIIDEKKDTVILKIYENEEFNFIDDLKYHPLFRVIYSEILLIFEFDYNHSDGYYDSCTVSVENVYFGNLHNKSKKQEIAYFSLEKLKSGNIRVLDSKDNFNVRT